MLARIAVLLLVLPAVHARETYRLGDLFSQPAHTVGTSWLVDRTITRTAETTIFPTGVEQEGEVVEDAFTERVVFLQRVTEIDERAGIAGALRFYREATINRDEGPIELPHAALYVVYAATPEGDWSMKPYVLEDGLRRPVSLDLETEIRLLEDAPSHGDDWLLVAGALADTTLTVGVPRDVDPGLLLATFDWTQLVSDGEVLSDQTRLTVMLSEVTDETVTLSYSGGLGVRGTDPDNGAEIAMFIELEPMKLTYRRAPFQRIAIDAVARIGLYGKITRDERPHEIKGKGSYVLKETLRRP